MINVQAVDKNGNIVWRDSVNETSDDSIGAVGETANFKKLHPLLINATTKASKLLLDQLKTRVS